MVAAIVIVVAVVTVVVLVVAVVVVVGLTMSGSSSRTNFFTTQNAKLIGTTGGGISRQGTALALSKDGNTLAISGAQRNTNIGAVWIFVRNTTTLTWTEQQTLVPSDAVATTFFASSVSLSDDGNTLVAGALSHSGGNGGVWIFYRVGTVWTQHNATALIPSDAVGSPSFGCSVSMSADGTMFAAGGRSDTSDTGAAWIYEKINNVWTKGQKLVDTDVIAPSSQQGFTVSLSGNKGVLAVAGPGDDGAVGAVWVYTRSGSTFTLVEKLVGTGSSEPGEQGRGLSVSFSGDVIAVSNQYDEGSVGSVFMFHRQGSTWVQKGNKLMGTGLVASAVFGNGLSLNDDGNILAVGCYAANSLQGGLFSFIYTDDQWVQKGGLTLPSGAIGAATAFGYSVEMSGNGKVLAVGAFADDTTAGATYIFA